MIENIPVNLAEEVGLVLVAVISLFKHMGPMIETELCIMAGCDDLKTMFLPELHEAVEFDIPVAENVRIRSSAFAVFRQECFEYIIPVFLDEIHPQQRQTEFLCHGCCIGIICFLRAYRIIQRRVSLDIIICQRIPVAHESTGNLISLLLQKISGDRRVDAA